MKEASKQSNKHLVSKWTEFLEIVLEIITTIGFSILITKLYIYIFTVYHLIKITSGGSSLVMQCAKDPELWLQRLGSMLWHSFDPGPRTSTCLGCSQKKNYFWKVPICRSLEWHTKVLAVNCSRAQKQPTMLVNSNKC